MVRFNSFRKTGLPFLPPHSTSPRQVSFRAPIWSINVKSAFSDDNSDSQSEYVDIFVGGFNIWNDLEVDGTHANAPTSYEWFSQGLTGNISILNLRVCQHFALGWHFTGILPARRREVDLTCSGGKPGWDFGQSHDSCPKLAPVQRTRPHWTTKKAGWRWARGVRSWSISAAGPWSSRRVRSAMVSIWPSSPPTFSR